MEKKGKAKFKKIVAILCIFVVLESYLSYFAQIVIATNEVLLGSEENNEPLLNEEQTTTEESQNQDELAFEQNDSEQDVTLVSEEEANNEQAEMELDESEASEVGEENLEGETEEQQEIEELVEEQLEETGNEEEEEPYVEPEISVEVTSENASIYKGFLYANATSELRYATNYNTIDVVTIVGGKDMKSLTIQDEPDKIQLITSQKIALKDDMHYRKTRVSVDEFNSIFGEYGYITVSTPEGEIIGYITKDSPIVNNEYVFEYPMYLNSVKFELQLIQADGSISIKNDKSIKETSAFSRNQISLFATINTIAQVGLYVGEELRSSSAEGNINLEETESRMTLDVDTDTLSVEDKNDVTINVTLKTDEERYDLFENPTVDLEFPSAVEEVKVTGITLLYKNGLSIDNWSVTTNSMGRKVLRINLAGSQLEYTPGAVQEGTTIVTYTEIDVNRLTADTSENLRMTYSNKDTVRKTYSLEGKDSEDISFSFVGRQELVRSMEIKTTEENKATSYDDTTEKIEIEANKEQIVTITSSIVNNYETTIEDVVIVGRIPFVGNKDENGNDLGTSFDTRLQNAIITSGAVADVYYSEDGLAKPSDGSWSQDIENLEKYKSFKIVVREKTLAKGERVSFEYHLVVPEEVGYNAKGYSVYNAFYKIDTQSYTNECFTGMYTATREIGLEDIEEGAKEEVAELTIGTQVSQCGIILGELDSVYERQILKYTVVVKNTSHIAANNIVLRCNAENANLYYFKTWLYENYVGSEKLLIGEYVEDINNEKGYEEFSIDTLAPGESKTFEYQVIVKDLNEIETSEVYGKIRISADYLSEKTIDTIKNEIVDAKVEIRVAFKGTEAADRKDKISKTSFYFKVYIKNLTDTKLHNAKLAVMIPDSMTYIENTYIEGADGLVKRFEKNQNGSILQIEIPEMDEDYENYIYIPAYVNGFDKNLETTTITIKAELAVDDEIYHSNDYSNIINQSESDYEYTWTSEANKTVLEDGDIVTYLFKIKNTGVIDILYAEVEDNVPRGLTIEEVVLMKEGETKVLAYDSTTFKVTETFSIEVGKQVEIRIKAKVNEKLFDKDQATIENRLTVRGGMYFDTFDTDVISYEIHNTNVTEESDDTKSRRDLEYIGEENIPEEDHKENDNNHNHPQEDLHNHEDIDDKPQEQNHSENTDRNHEDVTDVHEETHTHTTTTTPTKTYYISGLAWVDSNQDGIRQSQEMLKEGVVAILYKANSNGGLDTSNIVAETATSLDGKYTFKGVEPGNYIIVFDYNASRYKVTKYQVSTAKSNENSDAISKAVTMNGEMQIVGVTDVLTVSQSSLVSIDIGLVDRTNFDLSLKKYIETVTVKNNAGTKVYDYQNSQNARLELRSKYYKSTILDIKYKFKVTNEGEVSGYVNKIVDYLPKNVEVVLNSSPGWYIGADKGLYYAGLVNQEIEPGKTEEFTLVVRKSLANGEAVKIENSAEIMELTNSQGLLDKDSIENNKMQAEDDYSQTMLMISISTGNTVPYIVAILIIIIMISVIVVLIIRFKNTKKIYR